ncbi:hypothetical protein DUNSADRAFT_18226 [Dunaliella salina]|uniref:Encoded protein n=1 Tax=Dunaliella salina TaxID=3046 RepID=A0ABQ7GZB1_DUNSA|nr:hypothetical protein DUNSADRAFT_18226 [Dunaliella salina]|eukprot:KAF5839945.1 hypothetical protein DUNSADRAFT_18226 [Dunaliella salina]
MTIYARKSQNRVFVCPNQVLILLRNVRLPNANCPIDLHHTLFTVNHYCDRKDLVGIHSTPHINEGKGDTKG